MRVENVKGAVWTVDELEFYKRRPQRLQERMSGYVYMLNIIHKYWTYSFFLLFLPSPFLNFNPLLLLLLFVYLFLNVCCSAIPLCFFSFFVPWNVLHSSLLCLFFCCDYFLCSFLLLWLFYFIVEWMLSCTVNPSPPSLHPHVSCTERDSHQSVSP